MLTTAVDSPALPSGYAGEPKWDGFRAQLSRFGDGRVLLRSTQGTDVTAAFTDIREAAFAQLPQGTGLDGEPVVWESGRLAFERLQQRLGRRGAAAVAERARRWPAHYIAFDLLHTVGEGDVTGWPYARRRAAPEALFADRGLVEPFTLCPSTTDPTSAAEWLAWSAAGVEGLCFKRLDAPYRAGVRSPVWQKYKVRMTTEAIAAAVTGPLAARRSVLLGRHDTGGRLRYTGRTTTLPAALSRALADRLTPPDEGPGAHPCEGWTSTAGWGAAGRAHAAGMPIPAVGRLRDRQVLDR
ncbi:ATP-dependent DNA ligase [Streptomyces sp. SID161]|nr:ATP-dependent DNA ligase [Streptomyces sp. SID161]MYW43141.1 ATP-dependent DNA ligase [Streptomyces sp. SID161]